MADVRLLIMVRIQRNGNGKNSNGQTIESPNKRPGHGHLAKADRKRYETIVNIILL